MLDEVISIRGFPYVVTVCGTCGVVYVVQQTVYNNHRDHGGYHHCPSGHQWGWLEGRIKEDALRQERDRLKQDNARLRDERNAAVSAKIKAQTETAKVRKRAVGGVCPCCKRTFANVQRHMKTKHPNVVALEKKA